MEPIVLEKNYLVGRISLPDITHESWLDESYPMPKENRKFYSKRLFDLVIIILTAPLALIILLISVVLTWLLSNGPVFFKQLRVGKNGAPFMMYKIRTMVHNPDGHEAFTIENDKRVEPFGKLLRRTKMDELPQLLNVLRGEMSLVGPRPEKVSIVNELEMETPVYAMRHSILPGISGWAQVNLPLATPKENLLRLEYDLFYIKHVSVWLDLKILLRTVWIIVTMNSI